MIDDQDTTKKSLRLVRRDQGRYHARKGRLLVLAYPMLSGRNARRGKAGDVRQNEGNSGSSMGMGRRRERREMLQTRDRLRENMRWKVWLEGEGAWLVRGKGGFEARAEKNGKVEFLTW